MHRHGRCKAAGFFVAYIFTTCVTAVMLTNKYTKCAVDSSELVTRMKQLSRDLNAMQEKYQQLWCSVHKNKNASQTGGYCDYEVGIGHKTDNSLATALIKFFANKTVISLGDGPGVYRRLMRAAGVQYDAYDGSPNINKLTNGSENFLDLTLPQYWLEPHDWAMSLEVIEHIPARYENTVLDNIARVARQGIILSWGVPGQPGFFHVNNQPPAHVDDVMGRRSFKRDETATKALKAASSLPWLKSNVNVFRRQGPFTEQL